MSDNDNRPPGWDEADESKVEDSLWGDNTSTDDEEEEDSSKKLEISPVSNTPLNTKLIIGIASVVVALAIAFFGGMFVFDMFKNGDGEVSDHSSSDVVMWETTDDANLGITDPSDSGQTPTETPTTEPLLEPTVEPTPTPDITQTPTETPTIEPTLEPTSKPDVTLEWQSAYEKVINGENERGIVYKDGHNGIVQPEDQMERYEFSLVDFDGNGIPELVIRISGWEWNGLDVYSYHEGDMSYSQVMGNLFMQEKSRTYITALHYDCVYVRTYDLKKGKFVEVDFLWWNIRD